MAYIEWTMPTSRSPSHPRTITRTTNNNAALFDMEPRLTSATTFVQAHPSDFRALVQKLTGPSTDSSNLTLPVTYSTQKSVGTQPFRLQERSQSRKKLEINLQTTPMSREELEDRGIAEKGYYMHPTPPGCTASDPPQLLPLFPLGRQPSTSTDP